MFALSTLIRSRFRSIFVREGDPMFQLIRALSARQLMARQMPIAAASFVIAEVFYKFHSFALECGAFLLTWFAIDALVQGVTALGARLQAHGSKAQA